jgi:hypothetical protein
MWQKFKAVNNNSTQLLEEYYAENANMEKDKRFGKEKPRQKEAKSARKRKLRKRRKRYVFTLLKLNYFISLSGWYHLFYSPLMTELPF